MLTLQLPKNAAGCLSAEFLCAINERAPLSAFVETGTYLGETTAVAGAIFPLVHTIELSQELAEKARARFAASPHIHVHQGDSAAVLADLVKELPGPTCFWLDGHYSEGITARGSQNTPIREELHTIARSAPSGSVILIDDLRLFDNGANRREGTPSLDGYPSVGELYSTLSEMGFQLYVIGDVGLAVSVQSGFAVSPLLQALTISRAYDGENLDIHGVFEAESLIMQAQPPESEVLIAIASRHGDVERFGLGLHYRFWRALCLLGQNRFAEAGQDLAQAVEFGFNHWRMRWYFSLFFRATGEIATARKLLNELLARVPDFSPARKLLEELSAAIAPSLPQPKPATSRLSAAPIASNLARPSLSEGGDTLQELEAFGLYRAAQPLRLHLGCGEQHFEGYVNIDYPPAEHTCQTRIGADVFGNITKLHFQPGTVDEIRLHHVFEHFKRSDALALLIVWHKALKVGGRLHIETPDVDGCARQLVSNIPFRMKQAVIRHCFGSQEAGWAIHYDGWTAEKYSHVLGKLGFAVRTATWCWQRPPHLANVDAVGDKIQDMPHEVLLAAADEILSEYMVADVPIERRMFNVWRNEMRLFLESSELVLPPANLQGSSSEAAETGSESSTFTSPRSNRAVQVTDCVIVKLQGGLGNQMFQYAAGLAITRRTKAKLKLDKGFLLDRTPRPNFTFRDYDLELFELPTECELIRTLDSEIAPRLSVVKEKHFRFDPQFHATGPNVYLDGYWQSPRYFGAVAEEIKRTFTSFRSPLDGAQQILADAIRRSESVCLNVRRADYVTNPIANAFHGVCDERYFRQAVRYVQQRVPKAHFYIFSDDVDWCREANLVDGAPATIVGHEHAGARFGSYLQLMIACRHFIIPNSSFAWWAAYLGQSADSVVVAPTPWFNRSADEFVDLLPVSWKLLSRVPGSSIANSGVGSGDMRAPGVVRVSIVVTCYNYGKYLRECVRSVANQTFKNFELIIVNDGSTDDSQSVAEACLRDFPKLQITLVNQPNSGQPALARNAGIRHARGEFVLPLDADDQIDPKYLEEAFKAIDANSKVDLVYSDSLYNNGKTCTRKAPGQFNPKSLSVVNQLVYCCVYRRALWEKIGGYRANVRGYEDWDFWLAASLAGATAEYVGCVGLVYNEKDSGVFSQTVPHHSIRIARIMLNNPAAYTSIQLRQARDLVETNSLRVGSAGASDGEGSPPENSASFGRIVGAAEQMIREGQLKEAFAMIEQAMNIAPTAQCVTRAREILDLLRAAMATKGEPTAGPAASPDDFFEPDEVQNIEQLLASYSEDPRDPATREQLGVLQQALMRFLVTADRDGLEAHFRGSFGRIFRALVRSGLSSEPPGEAAQAQLTVLDEALVAQVNQETSFDFRPLLARMLCAPVHRGSLSVAAGKIPAWLLDDYVDYRSRDVQVPLSVRGAGKSRLPVADAFSR